MSSTPSSTTPSTPDAKKRPPATSPLRKRIIRTLIAVLIIIGVVIAWQLLNTYNNSTGPSLAGRPLSNPHTHLHTVALGERPGVLYLGTHYGLFTSTDWGRTWPQSRGALNTSMVTAIAVSPSNPDVLAVIIIPTSGIGQQLGIAFSHDGGTTWQIRIPPGLSPSAYPFTVKAGSGGQGQFYAFYNYAGWFETRDLGAHWYPITSGSLSNMQTPSLLTDPVDPNHLLLGGEQGLYESRDDGNHWSHIPNVRGAVNSLAASSSRPRIIFCATDQVFYRWRVGSVNTTEITNAQLTTPLTRIVTDARGDVVYGLSGQDLWSSTDSGTSWEHRWHFDRGDLVSLLVDPLNPGHLYAGFFLPPEVLSSTDGGRSWQILTN